LNVNMFSNINNIRYINLYNFKNDKIISSIFNLKDNIFFVCQRDYILINPNAYNCCNYYYGANDCISLYSEENNLGISTNLNFENNTPLNINNSNLENSDSLNINNINLENSDSSNANNSKIEYSYSLNANNSKIEYSDSLNSNNLTFEYINSLNSDDSNYENSNSSNNISKEIIIGIIVGGIIFIIVIIILIIYICNMKKNTSPEKNAITPSIKNEKDQLYVHEHEPMDGKKDPLIFIFENTNQNKVKILIDSSKTIGELIKFYFDELKKPDLYGDKSIWFLINGKNIYEYDQEEPLVSLMDKINDFQTITIVVNDSEEKIK